MPYFLNGEPLTAFCPFTIGDVQYSGAELSCWTQEELLALDGVTWTEPEIAPPSVAKALKALADRRWWNSQTFTYDGVKTQAEPALDKVGATLSSRRCASVPPEEKRTWKLSNTEYRQWDETQTEAFLAAIVGHLQAGIDREAELSALIIAAEDPSSVDTSTGWPG